MSSTVNVNVSVDSSMTTVINLFSRSPYVAACNCNVTVKASMLISYVAIYSKPVTSVKDLKQ